MARPSTRTVCQHCDRPVSECGPLSSNHNCSDCRIRRLRDNAYQLNAHNGEWFDYWLMRIRASLGVRSGGD